MKILWLANYPHIKENDAHPAPWMTVLLNVLINENWVESITIVSFNGQNQTDEVIVIGKIKYVYLKALNGYLETILFNKYKEYLLVKYLRNNEQIYDIIHVHGTENQFLNAALKVEKPLVISIQGIISEYKKKISWKNFNTNWFWFWASFYELKSIKKIEFASCRTNWDTKWVKSNNSKAKIFKIWEMLRPEFFNIEIAYSSNKDILYVGGTNEIKGYKELLIAFNQFRILNKESSLICAGNVNRNEILSFIRKNKLQNIEIDINLKIVGMCNSPQLIDLYKKAFCLIHPSYIDNSPNSICEAQVAGLPVIATDVGGVSSLIEHNETGILTSINPSDIFQELTNLYRNQVLSNKISIKSKHLARKRHNNDEILKHTHSMYNILYAKKIK